MGCKGSKGVREMDGPPSLSSLNELPESKGEKQDATLRAKLKQEMMDILAAMKELKLNVRTSEQEKQGLTSTIEELRTKLVITISNKDRLKEEREEFMNQIWTLDADDIKKACKSFGGSDRDSLVDILTARTGWQIREIAGFYEQKYKSKMHKDLENAFKGFLGGKSGLCRLILLRAMEPDTRDATLLREYSSGLSLVDEYLIEIIMTRSNAELKAALLEYKELFQRDLIELVKQKVSSTQPNYLEFMLKVSVF